MTQSKQDNEFKWLLPHSLVHLNNLVKHVSFVGMKRIASPQFMLLLAAVEAVKIIKIL